MQPSDKPNGQAEGDATGLWVSISELAARKGLTKQTVAERVSKFEAQGLVETRPGKGRTKLVNLAEFDRVAGETTDLGRELGAATKRGSISSGSSADPVYTQEQARRMAYQADREKLALGQDLRDLVPVDRLRTETARVLGPIRTRLDRIETRAPAVALAVSESGVAGARAFLRSLAAEICNLIADAAAEICAEAQREPARSLDDFDPRRSPTEAKPPS